MTLGSKDEGGGLSSDWVKRQLRSLSVVSPPRTLRNRLVAAIPPTAANPPRARRWPKVLGCVSVAAAIVMVASVAARLGGPTRPPQRPIINGDNGSFPVMATDTNSIRFLDMNTCDNNSPY